MPKAFSNLWCSEGTLRHVTILVVLLDPQAEEKISPEASLEEIWGGYLRKLWSPWSSGGGGAEEDLTWGKLGSSHSHPVDASRRSRVRLSQKRLMSAICKSSVTNLEVSSTVEWDKVKNDLVGSVKPEGCSISSSDNLLRVLVLQILVKICVSIMWGNPRGRSPQNGTVISGGCQIKVTPFWWFFWSFWDN